MLPFVGRTKGDENLMTTLSEAAGQVRDMPLAAAERPRR
jgi:hypothetical protein